MNVFTGSLCRPLQGMFVHKDTVSACYRFGRWLQISAPNIPTKTIRITHPIAMAFTGDATAEGFWPLKGGGNHTTAIVPRQISIQLVHRPRISLSVNADLMRIDSLALTH